MEMQFKNEINKLADVVVWADGIIRDGGYYEEKYRSDATTAYCHVKAHELWKIRDVVLESIERHATYTNALNKDIADKAAKIELLEKEIEGRKEGYTALKELMDTKYISIDEHNDVCKTCEKKVAELKKESEKWQNLAKMNRDTICNQYDVCAELKEEVEKLKVDLIHEREKNEKLARAHAELENDMRKSSVEVSDKDKVIADLEESKRYWKRQSINDQDEINHWKDQERIRTDQLRATESTVDELWKRIEKLKETIKNKDIVIKMYYKIRVRQAKSICALKKELEGAKYNIGDRDSVMDGLYAEIERKQTENNTLRHRLHSQEERHANQLNAAADEVEKLKKSFNALQQEMATRYIAIETHNDICKTYEENMEMEGDHGRKGFKEYIEWLVKEEEEKFKESWKARLNEELEAIFKEEEETEVKGRYPWGTKKNDIPCGSDSIE